MSHFMTSTKQIFLFLLLLLISAESIRTLCNKSRKFQLTSVADSAANVMSEYVFKPPVMSEYVFEPPAVGPEIYAGSIIAVLPIIYATVLFTERVNIQRKCEVCKGSGLVFVSSKGNPLTRPRKCKQCGGFLPFISWKYFFFSSFTDPGNGGVLLLPRKKKDVPVVEEDDATSE